MIPYINRELSWLAFNRRVLAQAADAAHPLLERVKFLAIVATNLDEFFMIRVAVLLRKLRAGRDDLSPDGRNALQQLALVRDEARRLLDEQERCWTDELLPRLAERGIRFVEPAEWSAGVRAHLARHFEYEIAPVLTPLAFDPGHPFPYISNMSTNLAVVVKHGGRTKFARIKLPPVLPRFVPVPGGEDEVRFAFLEDVVKDNLQALFPGAPIRSAHLFRVLRDSDMVLQDDAADDLLESVGRGLKQLRHGPLSMLQVEDRMPRRVLDILVDNFEIEEDDVIVRSSGRLGFGDWMAVAGVHRPELKDPPFAPHVIWPPSDADALFERIRHRDFIAHHPFDSFAAVEAYLRAAVTDPHVVAIKMTLYRIGRDSPLVDLLVEAAEAGKQVAVLVELKARFDERNNIAWANRLESAGVHVVYGVVNLKTHCKLCLVVRKEADGIRRYAHVGTGNYNPATARAYTDLSLFTAHPSIVQDVSDVFNDLTGYSQQRGYRALLVAPVSLRAELTRLIEREAGHARDGRPARLIFKVNAVTDLALIRSLYAAASSGVEIDLLVRGICCLRPGVEGLSGRIRVRSIVGRFLEHSRIFHFENGGAPEMFIGSADLMERNLDRRVEVLCPVFDPRIGEYLRSVVLDAYLRDTVRATELQADGSYRGVAAAGVAPFSAQDFLLAHHTSQDRVGDDVS